MFYNSKHRHGSSEQMPSLEYENQYYQRFRRVWIIRGDLGCGSEFYCLYVKKELMIISSGNK